MILFHRSRVEKQKIKYETIIDVSNVLYPVITRLRLLGCCPISIIKVTKEYSDFLHVHIKYSCSFFSLSTIYTLITIIFYSVVACNTILEDVYQGRYKRLVKLSPSSKQQSFGWALNSFVVLYYLWLILNPILISTRSHFVVQFINKIDDFSGLFEQSFAGEKSDFTKAKKAINFTRICNGIIAVTFSVVISYLYIPCLFQFKEVSLCHETTARNQAWFAFTGVVLGYTISFYQDTLMISLFHIIENMVFEVERGLKIQCTRSLVQHSDICNWIKLGRLLKIQVNLFTSAMGPCELASLLSNFLTWVLLAFMIINAARYESIVIGSATFFCCSNLLRLYVKAYSPERIRGIEKRIHNLIVGIKCANYVAETERSFLATTMASKPLQFHLCNVITLDSHLTVWLIGGVVTYLLVLLQFQDLTAYQK